MQDSDCSILEQLLILISNVLQIAPVLKEPAPFLNNALTYSMARLLKLCVKNVCVVSRLYQSAEKSPARKRASILTRTVLGASVSHLR